ncbi:hypothetical protein PAXINDRAFT_171798 [Paxillus involutus ATCC 200175]|uniref:Unplaced genomic scaffold PAXINscaffold_59, whole genome shotgun sequence n=1 Tax=Paxillus involutus ATCC 200175 TaxID=664439 RepID=A0A0C9SSL1_PAXIN|nr:hypothetical protein PAXINDRAFT_171798 [Paxillus involutus ATCC 200175]
MNGDCEEEPVQVRVNQRALVQKVLARYPEEFTVFRELVQNADDAGAENVEIEFQTEDYALGKKLMNGTVTDLTKIKTSKWVVKNDGAEFKPEDWSRLTNIADGNPDDQKIGAFGVGFFSVFSITDSPVVISGDRRKRMYYKEDQLMVESRTCERTKWTVIEMEVKDEQLPMPKPFDLSKFFCTAVTFLTNVKNVDIRFDGESLSEITRSRGDAEKIERFPEGLKRKSKSGTMYVKSVEMIPQEVRVTLSKLAYSAGSKKTRTGKTAAVKEDTNPTKRAGFFAKKNVEPSHSETISRTPSTQTNTSVVNYTIYSAHISSTPTKEMATGIETATKKQPPSSFLCEAVHFTKDQYQQAMQDGDEEGNIGSVFRGVQALCGEVDEGHGSRLFVGQSTAQTSGIATHVSTRFIPTVERGSIDLANGQVAKWNEELLRIGGFLTRLIYDRAMTDIRNQWPESASPLKDRLRTDALYIMKCFTFRQTTPDPKIGELLQSAFFDCSTSLSFPILSNLGIRFSKDVRQPHAEFKPFMKSCPILDNALWPIRSTMIEQLPEEYPVTVYTFRDVKEELDKRTFSEDEMIACIGWWVKSFGTESKPMSGEDLITVWRDEFSPVAQFRPSKLPPRIITLSTIKKFVDTRPRSSFIQNDDPLPPDTISMSFTRSLDVSQVKAALGWEHLTIVDWIQYLVSGHGLDPSQDICKNATFSDKVFMTLRNLWPSIQPTDRDKIVDLMRSVPCIPTNREHQKPQEAYFPEADLFNELPVVLFGQPYTEYETVLQALGVKRALDWDWVKDRLLSDVECSMMRLVTYLQAVRRWMDPEEFMAVKQLCIFACAGAGAEERRCIHEIYRPDSLHRNLGLPVLIWAGGRTVGQFGLQEVGYDFLYEFGLQQHPPLDLIIEKACSEDANVRQNAYTFFVSHLEDHYEKYNPANFPDSAFLPCGKGSRPTQFGTPEEVFTSSEWEIFGFHTIHGSIPAKIRTRLKVKDRPSAAAIIKAMQEKSPPDIATAKKWFDLLARRGGFSADDLAVISEMAIVPVQPQRRVDGTIPESVDPPAVPPNKCFYMPPDQTKAHHLAVFTYVDYRQPANSFLKMCGAKPNPDCSDIVEAMIENPHEYLNKIERYMEQMQVDKAQAYKKYLDDLRQVAAGYHSLSPELRAKMKRAPIFISFRKKRRESPLTAESQDYALKHAHEILIADDLESHRLFGEYVYVAPKEEVFENLYRDHGSESLSTHVKHDINHGPCVGEALDLRNKVFERLKIFLHDQDSTRRSDFNVSRWKEEGAFTVKFCDTLQISKSLEFEHAEKVDSNPLVSVEEPALAGIERIQQKGTFEKDTLWVIQQSDSNKMDWYDVAVALCRIIFRMHKTHDTLLLMTILDANLEDLRRRGYDVDAISRNYDEEANRVDPQPALDKDWSKKGNEDGVAIRSPFRVPHWLKDLTNFRKKKNKPGEFDQSKMDAKVAEALGLCTTDADKSSNNIDQDKSKGGKKQGHVKYCGSRQTDLDQCSKKTTKNGMNVFKTPGNDDPEESILESFSVILADLGKLFGLGVEKLHIFWQPHDVELMGFNRNKAIYLNLAHFQSKHHFTDDDSRAATYAAWYFIIAHEIAHNVSFFHDEDHELLFSSIAQHRLIALKNLLQKKAAGAREGNCGQ